MTEREVPPHLRRLAQFVADNDVPPGPVPPATLEALLYGLCTRGPAALKEPATQRRLAQMDGRQLAEIVERLLKPKFGQPWAVADVKTLMTLHGAMNGAMAKIMADKGGDALIAEAKAQAKAERVFGQRTQNYATGEWNEPPLPEPEPPPQNGKGHGPPPQPGGQAPSASIQPIRWMDMSNWDHEPRPERLWSILNRVPARQAGLFSGEGGGGKSIIEMMKDVAHVTGKDWLGSLPMQGPAWYIGAEDDENEIHIRFHDIAAHYGVTFEELITGGLQVMCLLGRDATLCAAGGKSGRIEVTDLYRQLYEAAGDIKPQNISVDTLSRAFAGNEMDRVQVYAFAMHMQALAMVTGGSVTILSHPSLQGINSGTGLSGSTAWHGAFRFRQYLKGVKTEGGEAFDSDLREIEFKKNQYGPRGETLTLRYQRGLFLPVAGPGSLERAAAEQKANDIFLVLLRRLIGQGRNVTDKTGTSYAPAIFADELEAKAAKIGSKELAAAMLRLFNARAIRVITEGPPSRKRTKIVEHE